MSDTKMPAEVDAQPGWFHRALDFAIVPASAAAVCSALIGALGGMVFGRQANVEFAQLCGVGVSIVLGTLIARRRPRV